MICISDFNKYTFYIFTNFTNISFFFVSLSPFFLFVIILSYYKIKISIVLLETCLIMNYLSHSSGVGRLLS